MDWAILLTTVTQFAELFSFLMNKYWKTKIFTWISSKKNHQKLFSSSVPKKCEDSIFSVLLDTKCGRQHSVFDLIAAKMFNTFSKNILKRLNDASTIVEEQMCDRKKRKLQSQTAK